MPTQDGPICVTGATGFVAGHIVKKLPAKGYTVHEETVTDTAADLVKWGCVNRKAPGTQY